MVNPSNKKIRVFFADDHALIRAGIRAVLEGDAGIQIVGEAQNQAEITVQFEQNEIDVLILDLRMPGSSYEEIITLFKSLYPRGKIIILSAFDDEIYVRSVSKLGIDGYILKDEVIEVLIDAIHKVFGGESFFSQKIVKRIIDLNVETTLNQREIEILNYVRQGYTYRQIGEFETLTARTVRFHMASILHKLKAKNRLEAVSIAVEKGWI